MRGSSSRVGGVNYTGHLTRLMHDIVERVPTLGFIDLSRVLVFARPGRTSADGAFASCHCLSLPPSEPGYFFWRDRTTGDITRRTEWFVTKSPEVSFDGRLMNYLISFALPRFTDQTLTRSRKRRSIRRSGPIGCQTRHRDSRALLHSIPNRTAFAASIAPTAWHRTPCTARPTSKTWRRSCSNTSHRSPPLLLEFLPERFSGSARPLRCHWRHNVPLVPLLPTPLSRSSRRPADDGGRWSSPSRAHHRPVGSPFGRDDLQFREFTVQARVRSPTTP